MATQASRLSQSRTPLDGDAIPAQGLPRPWAPSLCQITLPQGPARRRPRVTSAGVLRGRAGGAERAGGGQAVPGEAAAGAGRDRRATAYPEWWTGPEIFVIVDDYDLVATPGGNPLLPLGEYLPMARDLGLHLIIARASGGAGRALFEPLIQRLRESRQPGLFSGERDEGQLLGQVRPSEQPPRPRHARCHASTARCWCSTCLHPAGRVVRSPC